MKCFVKRVESDNDPEIAEESDEQGVYAPFTLLSLWSFGIPPRHSESRVLVDLIFDLAGEQEKVVFSRNTDAKDKEFRREADREFERVLVRDDYPETHGWIVSPVYLANFNDKERVAHLFASYGRTWGGNWFFADWPSTDKPVREGRRCFLQEYADALAFRASLFGTRRVAALTFDDKLFDLYVRCGAATAMGAVESLCQQHGIAVSFTDAR